MSRLLLISEKTSWMRRKSWTVETIADIVFTDKAKLEALNAIVHPAVKEEIKKKIRHEERKNTNLFILESALLIEDHYEEVYDELWYVYVNDRGP